MLLPLFGVSFVALRSSLILLRCCWRHTHAHTHKEFIELNFSFGFSFVSFCCGSFVCLDCLGSSRTCLALTCAPTITPGLVACQVLYAACHAHSHTHSHTLTLSCIACRTECCYSVDMLPTVLTILCVSLSLSPFYSARVCECVLLQLL